MKVKAEHCQAAVEIESKMGALAAKLVDQMSRPIPSRRKFRPMIDQFNQHRLELRAAAQHFERGQRMRGRTSGAALQAQIKEQRYFKALRQRLKMMVRLSTTMEALRLAPPSPLYAAAMSRKDPIMVQEHILDETLMRLHRLMNPEAQSEKAAEFGCYPDIPLGSAKFASHIQAAYRVALAQKRERPLRFLDVGCGGGMKVLMASQAFHQADGLDFDARYVSAANKAFEHMGVEHCSAFEANALTFERYDAYDVIYFFQPMKNEERLRSLEDQVVAQARPGTIIIAPYQLFKQRSETLDVTHFVDAIFMKGIEPKAAKKLLAEAGRMGPEILHPDRALFCHHVSWLRDLWMACASNGYLPD